MEYLFIGNFNLSRSNLLANVLWRLTINRAPNRESSSQNFPDSSAQLLGKGLEAHLAGNFDDLVEGEVTGVLDYVNGVIREAILGQSQCAVRSRTVLFLLTVSWGFLQRLDNQGGGTGENLDSRLTVLDHQSHGNPETLPVLGRLGDIFTDLLGGL